MSPGTSYSRLWVMACVIASALVSARALISWMSWDAPVGDVGLDVAASVLALLRSTLIAAVTLWAARRLRAPGRILSLGWSAICVGLVLGLIGDCWWTWFLIRDGHFPSASIADYFFLPMYPLLLVGCLSLPGAQRRRGELLPLACEFSIVLLAAFSLQWEWFIAPAMGGSDSGAGGVGKIASVAIYPLCDLLVLWSILVVLFTRHEPALLTACRILAVAGICLVVADTAYGIQVASGTFRFAGWIGILWITSGCLVGLAAIRQAMSGVMTMRMPEQTCARATSDGQRTSHRVYLLCMAGAGVLTVWSATVRGEPSLVPDVILLAMILLVLARLGLEIASTARLARELQSVNLDLDRRVQLRTAELVEVNERLVSGIAENLELEGQLRQAARVEALGRLAGGIAHDFNNVLTVIKGYGSLLQHALKERPEQQAQMRMVLGAVEHASTLTGQLLSFGRTSTAAPCDLDPGQVVVEVAQMLQPLLGQRARLEVSRDPAAGLVHIDRGQLQQVLMNLALNARDALIDEGRIEIAVGEAASADCAGRPGRFVRVAVADNGRGMDEATRARIFEPFFTTKAAGNGTGLGLATAISIVEHAGGWIAVESNPGRGSTFAVFLARVVEQ